MLAMKAKVTLFLLDEKLSAIKILDLKVHLLQSHCALCDCRVRLTTNATLLQTPPFPPLSFLIMYSYWAFYFTLCIISSLSLLSLWCHLFPNFIWHFHSLFIFFISFLHTTSYFILDHYIILFYFFSSPSLLSHFPSFLPLCFKKIIFIHFFLGNILFQQ